jgi:hypothetical protein
MTNFANHSDKFSHDAINRYMLNEKLTAKIIFENVKNKIKSHASGYIIFDDSVLDKNQSNHIEMVKLQYSGNAHGLIKGIGMVNCVYVNPDTQEHWIIDYRIYDKEADGKSKLDHVEEMLEKLVENKKIPFTYVLLDSWYSSKKLLLYIESIGKIYYCPFKINRLVDDSGGLNGYKNLDALVWSDFEKNFGKIVKVNTFPKNHKVKLFWVEVSDSRTDIVATNDLDQNSTRVTRKVCAIRWKIEQFHREIKQVCGIEKCQARSRRIQRNHIACAVLVWVRLIDVARTAGTTIYQVKEKLMRNYLIRELKKPSVPMMFA